MSTAHLPASVRVPHGTLVILSGLPGSGKSSLRHSAVWPDAENEDLEFGYVQRAWVCVDDLRKKILGSARDLDEYGEFDSLNQSLNPQAHAIARAITEARLMAGHTVVYDALSATEADRGSLIELAKRHGAPYQLLILDTSVEDCVAANKERQARVPEHRIREIHSPRAPEPTTTREGKVVESLAPAGFSYTSAHPFTAISRDTQLVFDWPRAGSPNLDVVGDVHGLLDELKALLLKAGWVIEEEKIHHPQGRKLLFLGDLVDRGPRSIETVRFVRQAVLQGVAMCLQGNHELKLVRFIDKATAEGVSSWGSYANAETGLELLKQPDCNQLVEFLRTLPSFCVYDGTFAKVIFSHANLSRAQPGVTPRDEFIYGQFGFRSVDSDKLYQERFDKGLNARTLVRGHIPATSEQENVFSLERHPFQRGELVLLRMDDFDRLSGSGTQRAAFVRSLVTQRCEFDYDEYAKRWDLSRGMNQLVGKKLATAQVDDTNMLRVFKYSKATFWNNSWGDSPWLTKARGIVLDAAGDIRSHPFDKCFNLHEGGAGDDLADGTPLIAVDKLNGFLGIVSAHPFRKNQLLVHTQGGFGGPFVGYVNDFLPPQVAGLLKKFFANQDVTLMFEVLHPEDPHIIDYPASEHGLWLIGVRGKRLGDMPWTEDKVDEAAVALGFRRPGWSRTTKKELLARCRDDSGLTRVEGWMARADTPEQAFLFKLKTPYYLVTKFLGRLSVKKAAHLFGNPADFKKTVDEEFYPLVDRLTACSNKESFGRMSELERVDFVRTLVNEML